MDSYERHEVLMIATERISKIAENFSKQDLIKKITAEMLKHKGKSYKENHSVVFTLLGGEYSDLIERHYARKYRVCSNMIRFIVNNEKALLFVPEYGKKKNAESLPGEYLAWAYDYLTHSKFPAGNYE